MHVHDHGGGSDTRRLWWVLALTLSYTAVEIVGGLWSNSLALLADAGHMLTDNFALGLALFAAWSARRPPDPGRTYGYQRAEILAALCNGILLVVVAISIVWEAMERLGEPPEVAHGLMAAVAAGGLVVNIVGAAVLHGGHGHNLNVRGAYLHVIGDLLGSIGALSAAGLMAAFGWRWPDPVASIVIAAIIVVSSIRLLVEAVNVLMEGVPRHLDSAELRACLLGVPGVDDVHDLHVWSLGAGSPVLTAHLVTDHARRPGDILREAVACLEETYGITHATLQIEPPDYNIVQDLEPPGPGWAD